MTLCLSFIATEYDVATRSSDHQLKHELVLKRQVHFDTKANAIVSVVDTNGLSSAKSNVVCINIFK